MPSIQLMCGSDRPFGIPVKDLTMKITTVKEKVESLTGIPIERMKLIAMGRELKDGTLGSNNVAEGATLHMMPVAHIPAPRNNNTSNGNNNNNNNNRSGDAQHGLQREMQMEPIVVRTMTLGPMAQPPPPPPPPPQVSVVLHSTVADLENLPAQIRAFQDRLLAQNSQQGSNNTNTNINVNNNNVAGTVRAHVQIRSSAPPAPAPAPAPAPGHGPHAAPHSHSPHSHAPHSHAPHSHAAHSHRHAHSHSRSHGGVPHNATPSVVRTPGPLSRERPPQRRVDVTNLSNTALTNLRRGVGTPISSLLSRDQRSESNSVWGDFIGIVLSKLTTQNISTIVNGDYSCIDALESQLSNCVLNASDSTWDTVDSDIKTFITKLTETEDVFSSIQDVNAERCVSDLVTISIYYCRHIIEILRKEVAHPDKSFSAAVKDVIIKGVSHALHRLSRLCPNGVTDAMSVIKSIIVLGIRYHFNSNSRQLTNSSGVVSVLSNLVDHTLSSINTNYSHHGDDEALQLDIIQ